MRSAGFSRGGSGAGFSLLEVVIAVGILSLIMLGVALALKGTGDVVAVGATQNEMERTSQNALDRMALELRDSAARVITVAANGSAIQFQVPVDLDGNGTVLDRNGAVEFGFLAGAAPSKGTITYRFVQNLIQGRPEVLDERVAGLKLNDDADRCDRFARGCVVRVTQAAGGAEVTGPALTGRWLVQPEGDWGGDINGDGAADPIFKLDAASGRVLIGLWSMQVDGRSSALVVHRSTSVCLRNR